MSILSESIISVRKALLADDVIKRHCQPDHVVPLYFLEAQHERDGKTLDVGDYILLAHEGMEVSSNQLQEFNETYHMLVNAVSTDYDSSLEMAEAIRRVLLRMHYHSEGRNVTITDFKGEAVELNGRLRYVQIFRYDYGELKIE